VVDSCRSDRALGNRQDHARLSYGPLMDIVLGIAGGILGGWIMRAVGFRGQGGTIYTVLVAIGGTVVLTWRYRKIVGHRDTATGKDTNLRSSQEKFSY